MNTPTYFDVSVLEDLAWRASRVCLLYMYMISSASTPVERSAFANEHRLPQKAVRQVGYTDEPTPVDITQWREFKKTLSAPPKESPLPMAGYLTPKEYISPVYTIIRQHVMQQALPLDPLTKDEFMTLAHEVKQRITDVLSIPPATQISLHEGMLDLFRNLNTHFPPPSDV